MHLGLSPRHNSTVSIIMMIPSPTYCIFVSLSVHVSIKSITNIHYDHFIKWRLYWQLLSLILTLTVPKFIHEYRQIFPICIRIVLFDHRHVFLCHVLGPSISIHLKLNHKNQTTALEGNFSRVNLQFRDFITTSFPEKMS